MTSLSWGRGETGRETKNQKSRKKETEMEGRESEEGKDREAVRGGRERRQRKPC